MLEQLQQLERLERVTQSEPITVKPNPAFNARRINSLFQDAKEIEGETGAEVQKVDRIQSEQLKISCQFRGIPYNTEEKGSRTAALVRLHRRSTVFSPEMLEQQLADQNISANTIAWPLAHKTVATFRGIFRQEIFLAAKIPFFDYMDKQTLSLATVETIAKSLIKLTNKLHRNNRVHRDIKFENLLVFETNHGSLYFKYCDLGTIVRVNENGTNPDVKMCGSPSYFAPELLESNPVKLKKADVFSLGIILYKSLAELIRNHPAWGIKSTQKFQAIGVSNKSAMVAEKLKQRASQLANSDLPKEDRDRLTRLMELIKSLTQENPQQRPDLSEALINPKFFSGDICDDIVKWSNEIYQQVSKPEPEILTLDYVSNYLAKQKYEKADFKPTPEDLSLIIYHLVEDHCPKNNKDKSTNDQQEEKKYSKESSSDSRQDHTGPITKEEVEERLEVEEYLDDQYLTTRKLPLEDPFLLLQPADKEIYQQLQSFHQNLDFVFNFLTKGKPKFTHLDVTATFRSLNKRRKEIIELIEKNPKSEIPKLPTLLQTLKGNNLTSNNNEYRNINEIFKDFIALDEAIVSKSFIFPETSKQKSQALFLIIQQERVRCLEKKQSDAGLEQLQKILVYPLDTLIAPIPNLQLRSKFWCKSAFFGTSLGYVAGGLSLVDSGLDISNLAIGSLGLYAGVGLCGVSTILLVFALIKLCQINQQNQELTKEYKKRYPNYHLEVENLANQADYAKALAALQTPTEEKRLNKEDFSGTTKEDSDTVTIHVAPQEA